MLSREVGPLTRTVVKIAISAPVFALPAVFFLMKTVFLGNLRKYNAVSAACASGGAPILL